MGNFSTDSFPLNRWTDSDVGSDLDDAFASIDEAIRTTFGFSVNSLTAPFDIADDGSVVVQTSIAIGTSNAMIDVVDEIPASPGANEDQKLAHVEAIRGMTIYGTTVLLDTSNFDNILSYLDDTAQKALDTLDDMDISDLEDAHTHSQYLNKDGSVALTSDWDVGSFKVTAQELATDTLSEETADAGVTVDGVLIKDNQIYLENSESLKGREVGGTYRDILYVTNADEIFMGDINLQLDIKSAGARPKFNASDEIALISDLDTALASYLPLTAGSGSPLTGDLYLDSISMPSIFIREGGSETDYSEIKEVGSGLYFRKFAAAGTAIFYLEPLVSDGTSIPEIRFFKATDSSAASKFVIYNGDGNPTVQHQFDTLGGDVNLCQQGGSLTVGDATDKVTVDRDGILFSGTATVWDDLRVPATAVRVPAAAGPTWGQFKDDGSASTGVFVYWFHPSTENSVYFTAQMPHGWKEGSDIEAHVHWVSADTAGGAGTDVCWGLEYVWVDMNEVAGNTTIVYGDEQSNGSGETLTVDKHYYTDIADIVGTDHTISSMLICRLFRDAAGAGGTDDYDDDAGLLEFDFHYEIDTIGSRTEAAK